MTAIEIHNLSYCFPDGTPALQGIDLTIEEGERVGLIGANGAGKSTLLHHLNGLLPDRLPKVPSIHIFGKPLSQYNLNAIRQDVGLLFQDPDDQLFCPTVEEDIAFGPKQMGLTPSQLSARVAETLVQVDLAGFEKRAPHRLSRGQKRRVCLAGVLACNARILTLDEPTSDLDPRGRRELTTILEQLPITQMIASHDFDFLSKLCNRIIVLHQGKIVETGLPTDILFDPTLLDRYKLS